MDTAAKTPSNGQTRKTLASQLDRLDGILDGLDSALTGAVSEAVEQAVKQAVQAVLTEIITNRDLQEQLRQVAQPESPPDEEPRSPKGSPNRFWQATTEHVRRTVKAMKKVGRSAGLALLAAGGVVAGVAYAARKRIASVSRTVYQCGKRVVHCALSTLMSFVPPLAFGGT